MDDVNVEGGVMYEEKRVCKGCGMITVFVRCPRCGIATIDEERDAQYSD